MVKNADDVQTVLTPLLKDTTPPVAKGIDRALNVSSGDTPVSDDWVGPVSVSKIDDETYRVVIFYPSQPGSMLNLELGRDDKGRLTQTPVEANDSALTLSQPTLSDLPDGYSFDTPASPQYGLGESFAFLKKVRPYRRIFESAAVFRLIPPPPTP